MDDLGQALSVVSFETNTRGVARLTVGMERLLGRSAGVDLKRFIDSERPLLTAWDGRLPEPTIAAQLFLAWRAAGAEGRPGDAALFRRVCAEDTCTDAKARRLATLARVAFHAAGEPEGGGVYPAQGEWLQEKLTGVYAEAARRARISGGADLSVDPVRVAAMVESALAAGAPDDAPDWAVRIRCGGFYVMAGEALAEAAGYYLESVPAGTGLSTAALGHALEMSALIRPLMEMVRTAEVPGRERLQDLLWSAEQLESRIDDRLLRDVRRAMDEVCQVRCLA